MSEENEEDVTKRFQGLTAAEDLVQKILGQRNEILTAFIAKFGFEPHEAVQINLGNRWTVQKIDPEERKAIIQMVVGAQVQEKFVADVECILTMIAKHLQECNEAYKDTPLQLDPALYPENDAAYQRLQEMLFQPKPNHGNDQQLSV